MDDISRGATLQPYDPSWRDRIAAALLGQRRASPEYARVVEGLTGSRGLGPVSGLNIADMTPGLGTALAADELRRANTLGEAVGPAIGLAAPAAIALAARGARSAVGTAKTLASRTASLYDPPVRDARAFSADYPTTVGFTDDAGKLNRTIDGDPFTAKYVVGRTEVGGRDVALPPEALDEIATALTGEDIRALPAGAFKRRDVGTYVVERGPDGPQRAISVLNSLSPESFQRVSAHEVGHAIDDFGGGLKQEGAAQQFGRVYNDLNSRDFRMMAQEAGKGDVPRKYWVAPESFGYNAKESSDELSAEAIRAYLTDPNYIKSVAPKVAERVRALNSNPRLKNIIQFNSLAPFVVGPISGLGLYGAMNGGGEHLAAPIY